MRLFLDATYQKKDTFSLYKMRPRWLDLDDSSGREINLNKTRILCFSEFGLLNDVHHELSLTLLDLQFFKYVIIGYKYCNNY